MRKKKYARNDVSFPSASIFCLFLCDSKLSIFGLRTINILISTEKKQDNVTITFLKKTSVSCIM